MNIRSTKKYFKIKYNPTGRTKEEGFNCLTLALDWLTDVMKLNIEFEDVITEDITWENVRDKFIDNPAEIFKKIEKVFIERGYIKQIALNQIRKGDIFAVIIKGDDKKIPAVHIGMGKIMYMDPKGVKFTDFRNYELKQAYRNINEL